MTGPGKILLASPFTSMFKRFLKNSPIFANVSITKSERRNGSFGSPNPKISLIKFIPALIGYVIISNTLPNKSRKVWRLKSPEKRALIDLITSPIVCFTNWNNAKSPNKSSPMANIFLTLPTTLSINPVNNSTDALYKSVKNPVILFHVSLINLPIEPNTESVPSNPNRPANRLNTPVIRLSIVSIKNVPRLPISPVIPPRISPSLNFVIASPIPSNRTLIFSHCLIKTSLIVVISG